MEHPDNEEGHEEFEDAPIQWAVLQDIPEQFYSEESNEPLSHCIMCERYLLEDGTQYMVEKAMRRNPELGTESALFEMAVCLDCAEQQRSQLSTESLANIEAFFKENFRHQQRSAIDLVQGQQASDWLTNCSINGTDIEGETEYQLCGLCNGRQMVFGQLPYVLGGTALEALQDLLSEETKDEMNGFTDTYFGLPPELADLFKDRPVLVL